MSFKKNVDNNLQQQTFYQTYMSLLDTFKFEEVSFGLFIQSCSANSLDCSQFYLGWI